MQPLQIGPLKIDVPVLLAPMAGVADLPFRIQAQALGAAYTVSEMVAGEQLAAERPDMVRRAAGGGRLSPLVIQIAGREAKWMARAAHLAQDAGADVIDINMGCPCKRVTAGLAGSALMQDLDLAMRLIDAVVSATDRPVTLKMRLGWDHAQLNAPELAKRAEGAGVQMIVVHGRTRSQLYEGCADWAAIRATVDAVRIPVVANGDIKTSAIARRALAASGAAGVMVGRAANGAPWAPAWIAHGLSSGRDPEPPSGRLVRDSLIALYHDTLAFYGRDLGVRIARKHVAWALDSAEGVGPPDVRKRIRGEVCRMDNPDAVVRRLETIDFQQERRAA